MSAQQNLTEQAAATPLASCEPSAACRQADRCHRAALLDGNAFDGAVLIAAQGHCPLFLDSRHPMFFNHKEPDMIHLAAVLPARYGVVSTAARDAIKRPNGLRSDGLPEFTPAQVTHCLLKLANMKIPLAFCARVGHKEAIYFDTAVRAEAYRKLHAGGYTPAKFAADRRNRSQADRLEERRSRESSRSVFKGSNEVKLDPVITSDTRVTIAVPTPDRWAADVSVDGFASLRPGQYIAEAGSCAARACA